MNEQALRGDAMRLRRFLEPIQSVAADTLDAFREAFVSAAVITWDNLTVARFAGRLPPDPVNAVIAP